MEEKGTPVYNLPHGACEVLDKLTAAGYEAFLVGGCVRDMLRGVLPNDYDITTSATPPEIQTVFSGYRLIETGIRHGTVTVLVEGEPYEVTTYRVDGDYKDNRHPSEVRFTANLREDAARRDFTVNAMAYHPAHGLRDYFGGEADLSARLIRAVGDPLVRFQEDALRILRAMRFSATLCFEIERETATAARKQTPLLANVSAERVREELVKLLLGPYAPAVLLSFYDVIGSVLPHWQASLGASVSGLKKIAKTIEKTPADDPVARLAVFFSSIADPAAVQVQLDALRFDHRTRDRVVKLIAHRADPCTADPKIARRFLAGLGRQDALLLLAIRRAAACAAGESTAEVEEARDAVERLLAEEGACTSVSDLAIRGADLLSLGFSPGKEMGLALTALLAAVINGDVKNEKNTLLAYAKEHLV